MGQLIVMPSKSSIQAQFSTRQAAKILLLTIQQPVGDEIWEKKEGCLVG
jgi:hypothetical protein